MVSILFKPTLHQFATCREFVEDFKLSSQDLILTNQYIYQPYFGQMGLGCQILFQEQYGAGEPSDVMVDAILAAAAKTDCKRIVAIGGGTVIDIAKVLAVAGSEGVDALYDKAPDLEKKRELVIVPTTCGTGSEVTNISIMARTRMGTKLGLVSPAMYADQAVLIPELLEGLPFGVFATSSIDALVHAVESSLSPKATPYTKLFGYKAIEMLIRGYQRIAMDGQESRIGLLEDFLLASNYAGLAFGTAGCAAVHATSYPLGGKYHVPHGESNYAMFTGVLKNYMELRQDGEIAVLNRYLADLLGCGVPVVYDKLEELLNQMTETGALSREFRAAVNPDKIARFLESDLAARMAGAAVKKKLHKEQPFVLGLPASMLNPGFPQEETVLIQGIIDVYLEEEDGLVVADYKTDSVTHAQELVNRYQVQLDYYALALEQLTGRRVKEKIIYSFALAEEVVLGAAGGPYLK